jgi:hypothetical protein
MRVYGLLLALAACATDLTPPPAAELDPTGTWSLAVAWGEGTCGETGTDQDAFVVTAGPSGPRVTNPTAVDAEGSVGCTDDHCSLVAHEAIWQASFDYYLTLEEGQVTGQLAVTVVDNGDPRGATPCWQAASVTGALR